MTTRSRTSCFLLVISVSAFWSCCYGLGQSVPEIDYDPSTGLLTCTSTGGPVNEVEWQINGIPEPRFRRFQRITNTGSATYTNFILLLDGEPEMVVGNYSCSVRNSRGASIASVLELRGLQITGLAGYYRVSDSIDVTCFTDLSFNRITWYGDGKVLATDTSLPRLSLTLNAMIRISHYTCEVESAFGKQSQALLFDSEASSLDIGGPAMAVFSLVVLAVLLSCHLRRRNVERDIKDGNPQQHSPAKLEEGSENSVILDVETAPRVTVAEEAIYIVVCYCILIMIIITCGFVSFPLF